MRMQRYNFFVDCGKKEYNGIFIFQELENWRICKLHILNSIFIEHRKTRKTRMGKLKLAVIMATYHEYYSDLNYQL